MKHSTIRHRTIVLLEAYSAQLMSSGTSNRSHWLTTFSPMCQQVFRSRKTRSPPILFPRAFTDHLHKRLRLFIFFYFILFSCFVLRRAHSEMDPKRRVSKKAFVKADWKRFNASGQAAIAKEPTSGSDPQPLKKKGKKNKNLARSKVTKWYSFWL